MQSPKNPTSMSLALRSDVVGLIYSHLAANTASSGAKSSTHITKQTLDYIKNNNVFFQLLLKIDS